jgi:DNA-directed RNA polymerase specialized sigma24 family protein
MMINQNETREVLQKIIFKLTRDRALHDDLTQEALVHLWLREKQRPGQTQSWYLQSCRLFLQNFMRNGRSVDSKRRHNKVCTDLDDYPEPKTDGESVSCGSVVALVSAREILVLLARWLTPLERLILACLADGLGAREIASRLNISHTSVIRYRRRIAALALRLGVEPLPRKNARSHPNKAELPFESRERI